MGFECYNHKKCTFNSNDRVSMYLHPFQFSEKRKNPKESLMQQSSLSAEEKFNHYDACTLNEKTIRTNEKRKKIQRKERK